MMPKKRPSNSSSRAGRFKKKLVGPHALKEEAPILHQRISLLRAWLEARDLSESEFVALAIIATLSHRFPRTWPGARREALLEKTHLNFPLAKIPWPLEDNVLTRLKDSSTVGDLFNLFSLRSIPLAVNRALLSWGSGAYQLKLFFHIPKPHEVLSQQVQGERCVTVLTKESEMAKYVLGERDHLGFTLHDLIHADHFFRDNEHYRSQRDFYRLLKIGLERGLYEKALRESGFEREFDYLISDMNAYPVHLLKCLKAALVHYSNEAEDYFSQWMEGHNFGEGFKDSLQRLNTETYVPEREDAIILLGLRNIES